MAIWFYQAVGNDYFEVFYQRARKDNLPPELDTVYYKSFEVGKCCGFRGSIGTAKLNSLCNRPYHARLSFNHECFLAN